MRVRTVALALALACGFTAAVEARQKPVSRFQKHKGKRIKPRKIKPRKIKSQVIRPVA